MLQYITPDCRIRLLRVEAFVIDLELILCRILHVLVDFGVHELVQRYIPPGGFIGQQLVVDQFFQSLPLAQVVLVFGLEQLAAFPFLEIAESEVAATDFCDDPRRIGLSLTMQGRHGAQAESSDQEAYTPCLQFHDGFPSVSRAESFIS
jgi:hypothetical protein